MNTTPLNTTYSTEINSFFDAPNFTGSPERRLLLAILERAILDFVGNDSREIQGSSDWIFSDGDNENYENEFSFVWVCEQLDLDPERIANYISAMPKRGNHRIAPWYLTKNYNSKSEDKLSENKETLQFKRPKKQGTNSDSFEIYRKAS